MPVNLNSWRKINRRISVCVRTGCWEERMWFLLLNLSFCSLSLNHVQRVNLEKYNHLEDARFLSMACLATDLIWNVWGQGRENKWSGLTWGALSESFWNEGCASAFSFYLPLPPLPWASLMSKSGNGTCPGTLVQQPLQRPRGGECLLYWKGLLLLKVALWFHHPDGRICTII